jgi:endo-1,4-beta-mannosidase
MNGHAVSKHRFLATLATVAVVGGLTVSASLPAAKSLRIGAVADLTWGRSRTDTDRTIKAMGDAGVQWARLNVSWSGVEPTAKGQLNTGWLADIDYAVKAARRAGIQVLMPFADGVPYWASADPAKYRDASGYHWNKYWRPVNANDYAAFVSAMVNRYKVMGVRTYEIWNEPNTSSFWPSGPTAAQYVSLLRAASPAVKAADPRAMVVLGGLAKNDYSYLEAVYNAGGRSYFDVVAVHPYTGAVDPTICWAEAGSTRLAQNAFCGIEEVRRTMVANGDSRKSIWLTELGWSTAKTTYGVTETVQADYLTKALTKLTTYPYVGAAFWYNFRNIWWSPDDPASLDANYGLLRTNFSKKPAYAAFKAASARAAART